MSNKIVQNFWQMLVGDIGVNIADEKRNPVHGQRLNLLFWFFEHLIINYTLLHWLQINYQQVKRRYAENVFTGYVWLVRKNNLRELKSHTRVLLLCNYWKHFWEKNTESHSVSFQKLKKLLQKASAWESCILRIQLIIN